MKIFSIKKLSDLVYKIEKFIIGVLTVSIIILLIINVGLRYVFNSPFPWADEISRFLFTWISFIGASLAIKKKGHVAFENFISKVPINIQLFINLIINLFIIISLIFVIVYSYFLVQMFSEVTLSSVSIPQSLLFISLPFSAFGMILHFLEIIKDNILKMNKKNRL